MFPSVVKRKYLIDPFLIYSLRLFPEYVIFNFSVFIHPLSSIHFFSFVKAGLFPCISVTEITVERNQSITNDE